MYFAKFDTSAGNSTDLRNPSRTSALPSFLNGSRGRDPAIIDKIYESSIFPIANKIKKK